MGTLFLSLGIVWGATVTASIFINKLAKSMSNLKPHYYSGVLDL